MILRGARFQSHKRDKNKLLIAQYSLLLVGAILDFIVLIGETAERNDSPTWPNSLHAMLRVCTLNFMCTYAVCMCVSKSLFSTDISVFL